VQNYVHYSGKVMTKFGLKPGLDGMRELTKDVKPADKTAE
jgi:tRNA (cytidine32/uridine32-2'-O)-methyltransferase